jgi:hypothetical protein
MPTPLSVLLALISLALPLSTAFAQSFFEPPTAVIVTDDFSPIEDPWQPMAGACSFRKAAWGSLHRVASTT